MLKITTKGHSSPVPIETMRIGEFFIEGEFDEWRKSPQQNIYLLLTQPTDLVCARALVVVKMNTRGPSEDEVVCSSKFSNRILYPVNVEMIVSPA